ncbi:hypothetical protein, partial [Planktothrix agardhii]|uniref:hypothetical protein n=1 Tax=Planktothrix agardhii TaxID=1160 RepID=UPI0028AEDE87
TTPLKQNSSRLCTEEFENATLEVLRLVARSPTTIFFATNLISPKNEREAPGFRHGEESGCGFNRLQYFLI